MKENSRSLAQTLAIQSQIHLPGTVGRLLKQIRDIEQIAPAFKEAGLIKIVNPPQTLDLRVSGIGTHSSVKRALGGFLYGSAAVRVDLTIDNNVIATTTQDSCCELDDIDFDNQRKRLALIEIRQAYAMARRVLDTGEPVQLILMDCPLFLSRDMVPLSEAESHVATFEATRRIIREFWQQYREQLYPWNPQGPILCSVLAERFSAIIYVAKQDIRTAEGRKHLLSTDHINRQQAETLSSIAERVMGIGEERFINGILSSFTRTAAFRMTENRSRMEPNDSVQAGVIGFHLRGGHGTGIRLIQLAGEEPLWGHEALNKLCGQIMSLLVVGGARAYPLPIQLATRELGNLEKFVTFYRSGINEALKERQIESTWLSDLDGDFP